MLPKNVLEDVGVEEGAFNIDLDTNCSSDHSLSLPPNSFHSDDSGNEKSQNGLRSSILFKFADLNFQLFPGEDY